MEPVMEVNGVERRMEEERGEGEEDIGKLD